MNKKYNNMDLKELRQVIIEANATYRLGDAIISDRQYDTYIDMLREQSPNDPLLNKVGITTKTDRTVKLPLLMASMNKVKTIDGIDAWIKSKGINPKTDVVITPKYDGIPLLIDEKNSRAYTRGDGFYGEKSDDYYKIMNNRTLPNDTFTYTYGEAIMPKSVFEKKYKGKFANGRNMVAGLFNNKRVMDMLKDVCYMKYGAVGNFKTKSELLDALNKYQIIKVPYKMSKIKELTEDYLIGVFNSFKEEIDFDIDGIIVEVNDLSLQEKMGRETNNNNPCYARAFKHHSFTQAVQSVVTNITWSVSKQGLLKPVINIEPIEINGAIVSNVTGNNARFIKQQGIGKGSVVMVKRSGMVIPIIDSVVERKPFEMPTVDGVEVVWNEKGIELMIATKNDEQKIKEITSFFEILEADGVSIGIVRQMYDGGFKTIKDMLNMTT